MPTEDQQLFEENRRKSDTIPVDKRQLPSTPIVPENDPNFRNQKHISNLRIEWADYNFDGQQDYREQKMNDTSRWNYYLYSSTAQKFALDTLLSSLDYCLFDFEKQTFLGSKTTRVHPALTVMVYYEYVNGAFTLVRKMDCVHAFPNAERMDCSVYELENGELKFKKLIKGAE